MGLREESGQNTMAYLKDGKHVGQEGPTNRDSSQQSLGAQPEGKIRWGGPMKITLSALMAVPPTWFADMKARREVSYRTMVG